MGNSLGAALELLVLGMVMVFFVLLFLMFVMQLMSKFVNTSFTTKTKPVGTDAAEEELAVIMAVLNDVSPGLEGSNIQLRLIQ